MRDGSGRITMTRQAIRHNKRSIEVGNSKFQILSR